MQIRRTEVMPTRPCRLCIALQDDSVFADFELDRDGCLYLVRISFDGYGCCNVDSNKNIGRINKRMSEYLLTHLEDNYTESSKTEEILRKYFKGNKEILWEDALTEHGLV